MGKILRAFVNEDLQLDAIIYRNSEESQKARDYAKKLADQFRAQLNEELRKQFEEVVDAMDNEAFEYDLDRFICGYRFGALMTTEVFTGMDELLKNRGIPQNE